MYLIYVILVFRYQFSVRNVRIRWGGFKEKIKSPEMFNNSNCNDLVYIVFSICFTNHTTVERLKSQLPLKSAELDSRQTHERVIENGISWRDRIRHRGCGDSRGQRSDLTLRPSEARLVGTIDVHLVIANVPGSLQEAVHDRRLRSEVLHGQVPAAAVVLRVQ